MHRPGLLAVNRDSRRNVELVARRRSGTWPRLVQNIAHPVSLSPGHFGGYHKFGVTDRYSSDIQLHGKVFTRATAARSDGPYLSNYVLPALCWLSGLGLRPPLLLRWNPDLMKSSDTAMAEDLGADW